MSRNKIKKVYYRKIIRDNVPRKMQKVGAAFSCKLLNRRTFFKELLRKVGEEASGLLNVKNRKELVEELADIVDVIEEIERIKKISSADIKVQQKENRKIKGGFCKRFFLIWSEDTGYKTNERRY